MQIKLGISFLLVAVLILIVNAGVARLVDDQNIVPSVIGLLSADILVASVAAWIFSRFLTRQIRQLVGATSVISQGDLTRKVELRSKDEIGQLAKAFNAMLASLVNIAFEVRATSATVASRTPSTPSSALTSGSAYPNTSLVVTCADAATARMCESDVPASQKVCR